MAATITLTGNLGDDPNIRFTTEGRQVISLSIGCTPGHHDKNTRQWVDDGDPLWIRADFWGEEHSYIAETLRKGDQVSLTGALMLRKYTTRDGREGQSLELKFPKFLGKIDRQHPDQSTPAAREAQRVQNQAGYSAPAGGTQDDPWRTQPQPQQGGFDYGNPPF